MPRGAHLYVLLCDEPGPVSQQLVEALQAAQLGGGLLHAAQPALVPARLQVGRAVLLDQVGALVPRRCLKDPPGGNADGHGERRVR